MCGDMRVRVREQRARRGIHNMKGLQKLRTRIARARKLADLFAKFSVREGGKKSWKSKCPTDINNCEWSKIVTKGRFQIRRIVKRHGSITGKGDQKRPRKAPYGCEGMKIKQKPFRYSQGGAFDYVESRGHVHFSWTATLKREQQNHVFTKIGFSTNFIRHCAYKSLRDAKFSVDRKNLAYIPNPDWQLSYLTGILGFSSNPHLYFCLRKCNNLWTGKHIYSQSNFIFLIPLWWHARVV